MSTPAPQSPNASSIASSFQNGHQSITLMGHVQEVDAPNLIFKIGLLTGDSIPVALTKTAWYEVLRNVGDEGRDRVDEPSAEAVEASIGKRPDDPVLAEIWNRQRTLLKYLKPGIMVCINGIRSECGGRELYTALRLVLMHSEPNKYGWEQTHWWLQQINTLFEQWLDVLFHERREFTENDFSEFYRTNLNLLGGTTDNNSQECATMSRFLYGLSSAYLLTGNNRALSAARACSKYLINAFSVLSHDREYCFWKFGRRMDGSSVREMISSLNPDDYGSYALYEQIYALSGLTQYYRVTQDSWILSYIVRTITGFERFFWDEAKTDDPCFTGKGGYFSHIDPVTMRPDSSALDAHGNRMKKNWNSIGDHIPAYLVNLLLAIDPLPDSDHPETWATLRKLCRKILDECVDNILNHFGPTDGSKFVQERFHADWTPDTTWGWQQNRGIVGHNLKISWNLTRCAHYYLAVADEDDDEVSRKDRERAGRCYEMARTLGRNLAEVGVDLLRGGIYDALERLPDNGMPTQFAWDTTKDFWQQEQAILAYYIMHGIDGSGKDPDSERFLTLARYCSAFWHLFFVDQDNRKIYFRTTDGGMPVIQGQYGIMAGHAVAGYHAFELNYLAHLYIRTFVSKEAGKEDTFCLTFCPVRNSSLKSLNVLPDFFRPNDVKIIGIKVNGEPQQVRDSRFFQIDISRFPSDAVIEVEFLPSRRHVENAEATIVNLRNHLPNIQLAYLARPETGSLGKLDLSKLGVQLY